MFSVSGGDPDRSPALKWAVEVLLTAPAYSPYVFRLNFFYSLVRRARGIEAQKLPYLSYVVQSLLTKHDAMSSKKMLSPQQTQPPNELIVVIRPCYALLSQ